MLKFKKLKLFTVFLTIIFLSACGEVESGFTSNLTSIEISQNEVGTEGLIYNSYIRNGKKEYIVTDYVGFELDVLIPNNVDGFNVTAIGTQAFYSYTISSSVNIKSVVLPDSLVIIGAYAFASTQLAAITIPNNVSLIGNYAFANTQLLAIDIPNSVTKIGEGAFQNSRLNSVTIPSNVTMIGEYAFGSIGPLTIYVEATSKPIGWNEYWYLEVNGSVNVIWDYKNQLSLS